MDLEQAVGRLIIGKISGLTLDAEMREAIKSGIMGGVTLFKENAESIKQLHQLIKDVYELAPFTPIVTVDQEGGPVQRFDHVISPLPSALAIAACRSDDLLNQVTELSATQLKLLGINCLLAPVLDVYTNPLNPVIGTRSYGSNAVRVADIGAAISYTIAKQGLIAVGKHFPGHGSTFEDSHSYLAKNAQDAEELWQVELLPFRKCKSHVAAIMTGHIWLPAVDEEPIPASLSKRVTTDLLRDYLGFTGLIMTDDLLMKGVVNKWDLADAAVMAIVAGADQVMVCGTLEDVRRVHDGILQAVKKGVISEKRLRESIDRLNSALSLTSAPTLPVEIALERLNSSLARGRELSLSVSKSAISLLRGSLPDLTSGNWTIVTPDHPRYRLDLKEQLSKALFGETSKVDQLTEIRYPVNPSLEECHSIAEKLAGKRCLYLTFRTLSNQGQIALGKALANVCPTRCNIACDAPYDLIGLPNWDHCLATFDPSDLAMTALAELLVNQEEPTGTCPVSLQFEFDQLQNDI